MLELPLQLENGSLGDLSHSQRIGLFEDELSLDEFDGDEDEQAEEEVVRDLLDAGFAHGSDLLVQLLLDAGVEGRGGGGIPIGWEHYLRVEQKRRRGGSGSYC